MIIQQQEIPIWLLSILIVLFIWDLTWKMTAMWKAAKNNHCVWFICIAVFNTVGILPIIYILLNKKNRINRRADRQI